MTTLKSAFAPLVPEVNITLAVVYCDPPFRTLTSNILPLASTLAVKFAPVPSPTMVMMEAVFDAIPSLYPVPPLLIITISICPSTAFWTTVLSL